MVIGNLVRINCDKYNMKLQEIKMNMQTNEAIRTENHIKDETDYICVRDETGKLFAKMSPDQKKLRIMKRDKYVDIIVNKYGRMQVIKK